MATWRDVKKFVEGRYPSRSESRDGDITVELEIPNGRTQIVRLIHQKTDPFGDIVCLVSPIGKGLSKEKIAEACEMAFRAHFGGVAQGEEITVLQHTVLLENLDQDELEKPLLALAVYADVIEKQVTGRDNY